jgi:hypothetical protein
VPVALSLSLYLTATVVTLIAITSFADREEPWRVSRLLALALILRIVLVLVFYLVPGVRIFHEDASGNEQWASLVAAYWRGEIPDPGFSVGTEGSRGGYVYFAAALCFVLGNNRLFPALGNALVGAATCACVYRLARTLYGRQVAYRTTLYLAVLPSFLLWSAVATKEALVLFLASLILLAFTEGRRDVRSRPLWWTLGVLAIFLCSFVRAYAAELLALSVVSTAFIAPRRSLAANALREAFGVGVLAVGAYVIFSSTAAIGNDALRLATQTNQDLTRWDYKSVMAFRGALSNAANTGYAQELDLSNPLLFPFLLPVAICYFLYSPFPWHVHGIRVWLAVPETLLWWSLAPALWKGLSSALRRDLIRTGPIVCFVTTLTMGYSIMHGNVGVAYRQRTSVTMFLFIFVALGQHLRQLERRRSSIR